MELIYWMIFILSVLSLTYYILIGIYAGFRTTFSWIWLAGGVAGGIACFLLRFMLRNDMLPGKILINLAVIAAILIAGVFGWIELTLLSYAGRKADPERDYLIVLGAQVRGTRISKVLKKRLDTAFHYLQKNPSTVAIVSGGRGEDEDISEAEAMKRYLIRKGIEVKRIIMEDKSRNTAENIRYSKQLMKENATVALVTNGFHIYRAISIAKKYGIIKVQGLAAPTDKILSLHYYVREALGVLKDKLFGNM